MTDSYVELHCKTNFTFLEGASHADELARRAAQMGYAAWAVTDRNTLAGVVRAHLASKEAGIPLLVGAELTLRDGPSLVVWATDRQAYAALCRVLTLGRRRAPKGDCWLDWRDIQEDNAGLLAGVAPPLNEPQNWRPWRVVRDVFGRRGYLLGCLHQGPDDRARLEQLRRWSRQLDLPLAASGNVLYHTPARQPLFHVLTAIRCGVTVPQALPQLGPNAQRHLQRPSVMRRRFAAAPEALEHAREIAARCQFSLEQLRYEYPEELAPPGLTPMQFLRRLAWRGAQRRYPLAVPDKVRQLIEHELALIEELHYEAYFLTVWDLVRFARSQHILCQGRGSAANSAVCYCLGVTSVDPETTDVLFERFVSRERNEAPDIDVDFEHHRREEVLQYLYQKYGRQRAGLTAVAICYRARSAVRDVGKALGLSLDRVDALAKQVEGYAHEPRLAERCQQVGLDPGDPTIQRLIHLVTEIIGFPRHLSQHVGGMVITRGPLSELCPIENAAMPDRTVIQWDKDDLDQLGILKVDCLALGMLTAIQRCFQMVRQRDGRRLTLANIPAGDARVYDMICRAETMGVFQIESRAQMSMLPRLKPRCYYDLVIEVAIVRPGPIQGQMVHPYLRRRAGLEEVTYPSEAIRDVLHKTLGVPLFQEQAMRLAVVAAGFTPGEADQLRRAMGAWRRPGVIDRFQRQLIHGMRQRGLSEAFARQVFQQIRGFGEYGFPESHAASFALLVYVSAWLKHYFPAAFTASLLNSQPMGFYAPAQLIADARRQDVEVRPVDVNHSCWDCTLEPAHCPTDVEPSALRLGMRLVHGLSEETAARLVQAREQAPFRSVEDLLSRGRLGRGEASRLAQADALGSLQVDRRQALWESMSHGKTARATPLFDQLVDQDEPPPILPPLEPIEQVLADYQATGLSLRNHPLSFHRTILQSLHVLTAADLGQTPSGRWVRVAGLVLLRQRPATAKGITFVTLEDETGTLNLILRPAVWERFYTIARRSPAWLASGKLEKHEGVTHVVVRRLQDLGQQLGAYRIQARDFR